jgi:hypothetical protein
MKEHIASIFRSEFPPDSTGFLLDLLFDPEDVQKKVY